MASADDEHSAKPESAEQKASAVLKNLEPDSLSAAFRQLAEKNSGTIEALRPTLNSVSALIGKLQDIGLDQVGIELAGRDRLRELNMVPKGKINDTAYMILSIYGETLYLVRVRPDQLIDLHSDNLNKCRPSAVDINADDFWYKNKEGVKEARFFQYDLSQPDDCVSFVNIVLQTAAICAAEAELKQYNRPAETKEKLIKQSRILK